MTSIRHFPALHRLPDWRNLGVVLRLLLGANLLALVALLVRGAESPDGWWAAWLEVALWVEPLLLVMLGVLLLGRSWWWCWPVRVAQGLICGLAAALAWGENLLWQQAGWSAPQAWVGRPMLLAGLACAALLGYFELRARAASPAEQEARLAALNARIRPHFLFNTLNAVLSLIRARPQAAETALESLSDLFRAAMRDPAERLPLSQEIALCRQYLELEALRLGERLRVTWAVEAMPEDVLIPPLILQPLLENAVYHGIEPAPEGGEISIGVRADRQLLHLSIVNPLPTTARGGHGEGNRLALDNLRQRLALIYDLEARLERTEQDGQHRVTISLPIRRGGV